MSSASGRRPLPEVLGKPDTRDRQLDLAERNARLALRQGLRDVAALADHVLGPQTDRLVVFDVVLEPDQPRLVLVTVAGRGELVRVRPPDPSWAVMTELYGDLIEAVGRFCCCPVPAGLAVAVDTQCIVAFNPVDATDGDLRVEAAPDARGDDPRRTGGMKSPWQQICQLLARHGLRLGAATPAQETAGAAANARGSQAGAAGDARAAAAHVVADLAPVLDGLQGELDFGRFPVSATAEHLDVLAQTRARLGPSSGVECGAGWARLIAETVRRLAELDPDFELGQVKEKLAGLRIYARPSPAAAASPETVAAVDAVIREAEQVSRWLCEVCGRPDARRRGRAPFRLRTLCTRHQHWR